MLRLARFAVVLACAIGTGCPSSSEAGVIPWAYDALFGPVGSLQRSYSSAGYSGSSAGYSGYTPYYTGYSGYTGASYQPAAYSYGYANNGCSSCQQSSYYSAASGSCGCSPCGANCSNGGCASGNCATGNCTANSVPTEGLTPVADPNNYSRGNSSHGIESRLEAIEKQLNIRPPRDRNRTYDPDDKFNATPRPRTRTNDELGGGNSIPAREGAGRRPAGPVIDDEGYSRPSVRHPSHGTTKDPNADFPESPPARGGADGASSGAFESRKVNTEKADATKNDADKNDSSGNDSPTPADPDLVIPAKKPAATGAAIEGANRPLTLPLDSRITSKAVSPRERQTIAVGFQKSVVASAKADVPAKAPVLSKTSAPSKSWAGNTKSTDLAQHR